MIRPSASVPSLRPLVVALACVCVAGASQNASAQDMLVDVLTRHGVLPSERGPEGSFDEGSLPTIPIQAGAFAAPLAVLLSDKGGDQIKAAYTFGILGGRYGRSVPAAELTAAGESIVQMIVSTQSQVAHCRSARRRTRLCDAADGRHTNRTSPRRSGRCALRDAE